MLMKVCLAAALLCVASAVPPIENINHPGRIPGEYLIALRPAGVQAQKARYVQDAVAKIRGISADISLLDKFDALVSPILHFTLQSNFVVTIISCTVVISI